jgi:hypothetical protein
MAIAVKLSGRIVTAAQTMSKVLNRSVPGQIEYWAKLGKLAEENPYLNYGLIKDIMIAKQELKNGETEPYNFLEKTD